MRIFAKRPETALTVSIPAASTISIHSKTPVLTGVFDFGPHA
jgi:hypothetical protein